MGMPESEQSIDLPPEVEEACETLIEHDANLEPAAEALLELAEG